MEKTIFLDYEIVDTGNDDGFVLSKPNGADWERHLGNYHSVEQAKMYAIRHFMISRPETFHAQIAARMAGKFLYMDYFVFLRAVMNEGLSCPNSISGSDGNFVLSYNGKEI